MDKILHGGSNRPSPAKTTHKRFASQVSTGASQTIYGSIPEQNNVHKSMKKPTIIGPQSREAFDNLLKDEENNKVPHTRYARNSVVLPGGGHQKTKSHVPMFS